MLSRLGTGKSQTFFYSVTTTLRINSSHSKRRFEVLFINLGVTACVERCQIPVFVKYKVNYMVSVT